MQAANTYKWVYEEVNLSNVNMHKTKFLLLTHMYDSLNVCTLTEAGKQRQCNSYDFLHWVISIGRDDPCMQVRIGS